MTERAASSSPEHPVMTRRRLLGLAAAGIPAAAGVALIGGGGWLVADLWWRERTVGELAANTGSALALHGLSTPAAGGNEAAPQIAVTAQPAAATDTAPVAEVAPDTAEVAVPTQPERDTVESGAANGQTILGRVRLPSIDVDAPLVGVSVVTYADGSRAWQTADRAVGWHEGSAAPGGASGNTVLSGHISSKKQGDVFRRLPNIQVGDEARVTLAGAPTAVYRIVDKVVVLPSETWVMSQTKRPVVTLICCVPDGVYSHRLAVVGELVKA